MNKETYRNDVKGREAFFKQLTILLEFNADLSNNTFKDIHISQVDNRIQLEWTDVGYEGDCEGFVFLKDDEIIMKEVNFPDGHYDYVIPGNEDEVLKVWHEKHPEWELTTYGTWTNTEENRLFVIDCRMDEWAAHNALSTYERGDEDENLSSALECVDSSVLRKTDYIVVGPEALDLCCSLGISFDAMLELNYDFKQADETQLRKVGEYHLSLKEENSNDGIKSTIHVYYDQKAKSSIYFLTPNHDLIYVLELK